MKTIRRSITFTNQQDGWIKLRIQSGDYTNDSEHVRDLVRKDQEENMKLAELKALIDNGLQSGRSNLKISDIIAKVDNGEL
ncbi:type II toxin-antitoxin system ParD family antitoxin [Flagellimonas marinaquae]